MSALELLSELLALPLAQRIQAVVDDVSARTDKFRKIEPHDLAEALEVPQPWSPSSSDWSFTRAVRKLSLEEYAGLSSVPEVFERLSLIKDKLPAERFQYLDQYLDLNNEQADFDVLTAEERALLAEAIAWGELEAAAAVGMNCFARYSVVSPSGDKLQFEGDIEDDGDCIDLRTPYDFRDGRFTDVANCVTDHW